MRILALVRVRHPPSHSVAATTHRVWEPKRVIIRYADSYAIVNKLYIFDYFQYSYAGGKFIPSYTGIFFRKVAYVSYGVLWFVQ
jgi:hypothetical protein